MQVIRADQSSICGSSTPVHSLVGMASRWLAALIAALLVAGAVGVSGVSPIQQHGQTRVHMALVTTTAAPSTTTSTTIPPPPTTTPRASRSLSRPRPTVVADDAFWRRLANCESPSNARNRNGLYGGYFQMTQSSWHGGGGEGVPETHTYDEQLVIAKRWASMTNPWKQWPVCWPRAARG